MRGKQRRGTGFQTAAMVVVVFASLFSDHPLALAQSNGQSLLSVIRGRPLIVGAVNDHGPVTFMVDTGALESVLDTELVAELQMGLPETPSYSYSEGGEAPLVAYRLANLSVYALGLTMVPDAIIVTNLEPMRMQMGAYVSGILAFRDMGGVITLDFPAGLASWSTRADYGNATIIASISESEAGLPQVYVLLDEKTLVPAILDTGFAGTISIPEKTLRGLGLVPDTSRRLSLAPRSADSSAASYQVRLASLALGQAELLEPVATVTASDESARLGIGFLRHFRVTIDGIRRRVLLEAAGRLPLREPPMIGFGITPSVIENGLWKVDVAEGSPALEAGMMPDDALLIVNARAIRDLSFDAVRELLEGPEGYEATIEVLRGTDRLSFTLKAKRLL